MPEPALPLVFLPGASSRGELWQPIVRRLEKRRPPLVLDYPGLGRTPADSSLRTLADLAAHLERQLPQQFDVAALSMGAAVALHWAIALGDRVRRMALVAPCGGVDARRFGALDWREAFEARRPDAPRFFLDDDTHFDQELSRVRARALIIVGDSDLIAPVAAGHFLRDRLAGAKLEVIPGATHDIESEFPDLVASLIEAHLRGA